MASLMRFLAFALAIVLTACAARTPGPMPSGVPTPAATATATATVSTATPKPTATIAFLPSGSPTVTPTKHVGPASVYPDPARTPGALSPLVSQGTINNTICVSGWTATIRPPASYTDATKRNQMASWGLPGVPSDYEEDHYVPLELGGASSDTKNLWPQPWAEPYGAHSKDKVENYLHKQVCDGRMTLGAAQYAIRGDWVKVFQDNRL